MDNFLFAHDLGAADLLQTVVDGLAAIGELAFRLIFNLVTSFALEHQNPVQESIQVFVDSVLVDHIYNEIENMVTIDIDDYLIN